MNIAVPAESTISARELRRESILSAARKVFEKRGLEGASIRLIAKQAKCTTGSIYPYFKGKEEIYAEVLSDSLSEYTRHLTSEIESSRDDLRRFEAALWSHFTFYEERPSDLSLALYLFNGLKPQGLTKELDARLNQQLTAIISSFHTCFRAFAKCSQREAEVEIGLHFSMIFGLLTLLHTRRTRTFRIEPRTLLKLHIQRSVERYRSA